MSLSILFQGGGVKSHAFSLASAAGWQAACKWIESLPVEDFPLLYELARTGRVEGTMALRLELDEALDENSPESKDVRHTVKGLIKTMGYGDDDETATVID